MVSWLITTLFVWFFAGSKVSKGVLQLFLLSVQSLLVVILQDVLFDHFVLLDRCFLWLLWTISAGSLPIKTASSKKVPALKGFC